MFFFPNVIRLPHAHLPDVHEQSMGPHLPTRSATTRALLDELGPSDFDSSFTTPLEGVISDRLWELHPKVSLHLWRMLNEATKTMVPVAPAQSSGSGDAGQKYLWHVGSLFSGSGIALVVGHYMCALWKTIAGVDVEIQCVFQVEKDEEKRAHLLNHTCATHTFGDVSKVAIQQRLHCFRTNQDVVLPWAHTLFSGFHARIEKRLAIHPICANVVFRRGRV